MMPLTRSDKSCLRKWATALPLNSVAAAAGYSCSTFANAVLSGNGFSSFQPVFVCGRFTPLLAAGIPSLLPKVGFRWLVSQWLAIRKLGLRNWRFRNQVVLEMLGVPKKHVEESRVARAVPRGFFWGGEGVLPMP
jgi:hypothetical protein